MTDERKTDLYNQAWERLKNLGAKTELEAIAILEDEINRYRHSIRMLEADIKDYKENQREIDHDGCCDCKHEDKEISEEPCLYCKNNFRDGTEENIWYQDFYVSNQLSIPEMPKVKPPKEEDNVNHPKHYNRDGAMQSIDEMIEIFGVETVRCFCICNVWKYRYRSAEKGGIEDLKKSDWYMKKYLDLKERGVSNAD